MKEDVVVYYITGRQLGPLSVPPSWCEECDLTVRAVKSALRELDPDGILSVAVRPWLRHALAVLSKGAWHAPIVIIDGGIFSQGVVPEEQALRAKIALILTSKRLPAARATG